jgi:hypothetical protein
MPDLIHHITHSQINALEKVFAKMGEGGVWHIPEWVWLLRKSVKGDLCCNKKCRQGRDCPLSKMQAANTTPKFS